MVPQDPAMLVSFINMKLRDNDYEDLEDLCRSLDLDMYEILDKLKSSGFEYSKEGKRFI